MKSLINKTLPLLLALQLAFTVIPQKSDAAIIGAFSGVGAVFYVGLGVAATGHVMSWSYYTEVMHGGIVIFSLGIILDGEVPASHEIDFEKVTPESLALAYDDKTANTVWSELRTLEQSLPGQKFKFEFPKAIQDFVADKAACTSACKKEIKASEHALVNHVSGVFQTEMSNARGNSNFAMSPLTTRYLIEQMTGYTFLSTDKELSN